MVDGLVKHMKGLKKEDLAKLYSNTLMVKEEEEEEDEDDDEEEMECYHNKKMKKESIDQIHRIIRCF